MALTDVATARVFLNLTDASQDDWLAVLVPAACAIVENYTKRKLETASYTEYLDGNGQQMLPLRQRPVLSLTSVNLDPAGFYGKGVSAFNAQTLLTEGKDFVLKYSPSGNATSKSGLLVRLGGGISGTTLDAIWPWEWRKGTLTVRLPPVWPAGLGNVKVVYSAGYGTGPKATGGTLPEDLTDAANMLVSWIRRVAKYGGQFLQSENLNGYSYSVGLMLRTSPELGEVRQILSRYREPAL